jgi:hypothetical protein
MPSSMARHLGASQSGDLVELACMVASSEFVPALVIALAFAFRTVANKMFRTLNMLLCTVMLLLASFLVD